MSEKDYNKEIANAEKMAAKMIAEVKSAYV